MLKTKIISDIKILRGKPIIAGTRISVETILDLLSAGLSVERIIGEYPHLTKEGVYSAIKFAKDMMQKEEIYPLVEKNGQITLASA